MQQGVRHQLHSALLASADVHVREFALTLSPTGTVIRALVPVALRRGRAVHIPNSIDRAWREAIRVIGSMRRSDRILGRTFISAQGWRALR